MHHVKKNLVLDCNKLGEEFVDIHHRAQDFVVFREFWSHKLMYDRDTPSREVEEGEDLGTTEEVIPDEKQKKK